MISSWHGPCNRRPVILILENAREKALDYGIWNGTHCPQNKNKAFALDCIKFFLVEEGFGKIRLIFQDDSRKWMTKVKNVAFEHRVQKQNGVWIPKQEKLKLKFKWLPSQGRTQSLFEVISTAWAIHRRPSEECFILLCHLKILFEEIRYPSE